MRFRLLLGSALLIAGGLVLSCTPSSSQEPTSPDTAKTRETESVSPSGALQEEASSPPASDSPRTVDQRLHDATVTARIKHALVNTRDLRAFDFSPEVVRGHVTLRGDVDTRSQFRRAARVARGVEGVRTLTNRVTIEGRPASEADSDASQSSSDSDRAYYTVQSGDTLWGIARKHGLSVEQIKALNAQSVTSLQPGERIRVR